MDRQNGLSSVKFMKDAVLGEAVLITNNGNLLATHTFSYFLNGYIKTNLISGDSFIAETFYMRNSNQTTTGGADMTTLNRTAWTPFHVTLFKPSGFIPDSFGVAFVSLHLHRPVM